MEVCVIMKTIIVVTLVLFMGCAPMINTPLKDSLKPNNNAVILDVNETKCAELITNKMLRDGYLLLKDNSLSGEQWEVVDVLRAKNLDWENYLESIPGIKARKLVFERVINNEDIASFYSSEFDSNPIYRVTFYAFREVDGSTQVSIILAAVSNPYSIYERIYYEPQGNEFSRIKEVIYE